MWCASCAWLIEHAVGQIKGVERCRVYFASDTVKIAYKPAQVAPEAFAASHSEIGVRRGSLTRAREAGRRSRRQRRARQGR